MFDVERIEQLRDEYPINLLETIAAEQTHFEFNADEITEDKLDGLAHIIAVKLVSLGAFNTAWSHYLPKEKK